MENVIEKHSKLVELVKYNLILQHDKDDTLILRFVISALDYAEKYQHLETGYYTNKPIPPSTEQAVIMLSSHYYESRDGSTGGFFADNVNASRQIWDTVNNLLRLDRIWGV